MLTKFQVRIKGTSPLLMHSCRTANPLDEYAKKMKAITSKRNKTDDDILEIAKLEFIASCYYSPTVGFYIPAENIEACLVKGAKVNKNGQKAILAIRVLGEKLPLKHDSQAQTPEELYLNEEFRDVRFVNVNKSKILRCRPRFDRWECEFTVELDESIFTREEFLESINYAGTRACLGDYRPRYGSFEAIVEEIK